MVDIGTHLSQLELDRIADECECRICRNSKTAVSGPRVMSAVAAKPGESLVGLLIRTAERNHLPRLRTLLGACTDTWHAHFNLATRDDIDCNQLAHAARLAPHDVHDRRYLPAALTSHLPGVRFHGATIPAYDLQLRPRRLATSWLADEPFHCALGHHALATHCPESGYVLIDRCPGCSRRLTWSGANLSHCGVCGCNLAKSAPQRVTERHRSATRLMLDLIHPDPSRYRGAVSRLPSQLASLDRGTIFELGWRFGALLSGTKVGPRTAAKHLPLTDRLQIFETGSIVLASWPDTIRLAMQGVAAEKAKLDPRLPHAVRSVATAKNAWPTLRDAIYNAVPGIEISARTGVRSVFSRSANASELAIKLGVSQRIFERLRDADTFVPISKTGDAKSHQIFDASPAERLRSLFTDRTPLTSVSERLGISVHGAEQLCCLGQLTLLDDASVIAALKWRQITMSSFEDLRGRLKEAATSLDEGSELDLLPIRRALRSFGGREKPWGPIVVAMLTGDLFFAINPNGTKRFMDDVFIPAGDAHRLAAMRFERNDYPRFAFGPFINRRDAEELLNIDPSTFSRAVKNGELPATRDGKYSRDQILDLAAKNLSVSEALARWTDRGRSLPKSLKGRGAPMRTRKLGWNRAEVELANADPNRP